MRAWKLLALTATTASLLAVSCAQPADTDTVPLDITGSWVQIGEGEIYYDNGVRYEDPCQYFHPDALYYAIAIDQSRFVSYSLRQDLSDTCIESHTYYYQLHGNTISATFPIGPVVGSVFMSGSEMQINWQLVSDTTYTEIECFSKLSGSVQQVLNRDFCQ